MYLKEKQEVQINITHDFYAYFLIKRTLFYGFKNWKKKVFQINQEVQIIKIEKFNIYIKKQVSLGY